MRFNLICYREVMGFMFRVLSYTRVNKAFKKDSQRLAYQARMLRFTASRCSPLNAALGAMSENLMIITWLHLKVTLLDLILSVDSMDAIYE